MAEIIYKPVDAGKEVMGKRGTTKIIRKFHLTEEELEIARERWDQSIENESAALKRKAGKLFFNPYRKGIYYYSIQALFLLGANEWHSFPTFLLKLEEIMGNRPAKDRARFPNSWEEFKGKTERDRAARCRDFMGRIQENMVMFQRLTKLNPYGYKLRQVGAAVDIKRVSKDGFPSGLYYYRLSTYKNIEDAIPVRDFKGFKFPRNEGKYISKKFIGTVVTKDRVIISGEEKKRSYKRRG
jgi:hypothetical protein